MFFAMDTPPCQDLAVPAQVMQHVVEVESGNNPFAIGVVGGQLVRQPANLGEAVATVKMLEQKGYNYSVGAAQVNRANLAKFGLDTVEKAFDMCPNVVAGSKILAQCFASAGGNWGKSFSCYYSGNFTTGFQDGYVKKVFDSLGQQAPELAGDAIPLQVVNGPTLARLDSKGGKGAKIVDSDSAAYRVALRSVADAAMSAAITGPISRTMAIAPTPAAVAPATPFITTMSGPAAAMDAALAAAAATSSPVATRTFVPQVSVPGDPAQSGMVSEPGTSTQTAPASIAVVPQGDPSDLRQGARDDAFVF